MCVFFCPLLVVVFVLCWLVVCCPLLVAFFRVFFPLCFALCVFPFAFYPSCFSLCFPFAFLLLFLSFFSVVYSFLIFLNSFFLFFCYSLFLFLFFPRTPFSSQNPLPRNPSSLAGTPPLAAPPRRHPSHKHGPCDLREGRERVLIGHLCDPHVSCFQSN